MPAITRAAFAMLPPVTTAAPSVTLERGPATFDSAPEPSAEEVFLGESMEPLPDPKVRHKFLDLP